MDEKKREVEKRRLNEKRLDFVYELVMLKSIYGQGFITKDEMKKVRLEIMKKYGIKGHII